DTGIGISADALDKIFENFTQADASTSRSFGGTGLGTTISRELVNLMGGNIGVESEVNKGSTFWFELPFVTKENSPQPSIAKNRILLLANEETASIVKPALKSWDVSFDWVSSSARALASLLQAKDENRIYESVLVDQSCLVDINAIQFSQMVKSENNLDSTALVLINSSDTMIDANRTNQFYISTIEDPEDKRLLFNAIHAALSVNLVDQNIISMADHYESYSGARALNILVAEDNLVNQQVIQGILKNAGHDIRLANTGDQAMSIISNELESIDLIIVDMNMPEISGIEVVKALRFLDSQSTIPVIMLTADATPEAKEASLDAGANKFLTKPVDARRLLEVIARLTRPTINTESQKPKTPLLRQKSDITFKESEWYNNAVLEELNILGGTPEFILSLVNNYATDGSKHILRIKTSIDDDYLVYRESLHALKGSSTELGATKLVDRCIAGENLKPYDLGGEQIHLICEELEDGFNNTVTALLSAVTDSKKKLTGKASDV
ncbi:MAG: response regulator, partial [Flavobacteriaceae bacterium]|nr:response regulator [Flavobacteriaceae bacterium]